MGNYHVLKYGQTHFLKIFGAAALAGSLVAAVSGRRDDSFVAEGGIATSGGLIAYHIFKNPSWFRFGLGPIPLLGLFTLYCALYKDKVGLGGAAAGYLAFLAAIWKRLNLYLGT